MLKEILLNFGAILCDLLSMAIFFQILLSWVIGKGHPLYDFLDSLTSPVLKPIKKAMPRMGMFDLSPMVALFGLEIVKTLWTALIMAVL